MTDPTKIERLRHFFYSKGYILLTAVLIFLAHSTLYWKGNPIFGGYQEFLFGALLLISMDIGFLVCDDLRFFIMPMISFIFLVPVEHSPNVPYYSRFYIQPLPLTIAIVMGLLLITSVIWFAIRNRHRAKRVPYGKSVFLSMAVFCGALFFNGAFTSFYTVADTVYPISFVLSLLCIYALFAAYMRFDHSAFDYFMSCLVAAGLLICAELLWAYLTGTVRFENGSVVKESVVLGWGVWTAIGGMLAFLMPACFYFAHTARHGWIFYWLGLLEYGCIFLSQSRGGLLIGSGVLGLCVIRLCINGSYCKRNRILTVCMGAVGLCGAVLLFGKLMGVLQNYLQYGFGDNGRFDMWRIGLKNFLRYPIFGAGFYNSFINEKWLKDVYPYLYHNTLIQLLGSGGLLAFGAYAYHRICTVRLALRKPNVGKCFLSFGILGFILFCLLDVLFFSTYPTMIYALMLLFMEKSEEHFAGETVRSKAPDPSDDPV